MKKTAEEQLYDVFEQSVHLAIDTHTPMTITDDIAFYVKGSDRFAYEGTVQHGYESHLKNEQSFDPSYALSFKEYEQSLKQGYAHGDELSLRRLILIRGMVYYDNEYVE